MTKVIQSEVYKDILLTTIQSAPSVNHTLRHKLIIEKKDMEKVADTVVDIIKGEPLTKLVNKAVDQVLSSHHFQLSLSGPIERKVEKLTEIAVAQSKLISQLQEDMKTLK